MPPKSKKKQQEKESKKATQKKKEKMLEDKTFGLKNKKKSSKVQAQIKSVEKSIMNTGDRRQRQLDEQRKQAKLAAKARKKAEQQEQDALFGEALLAISKKTSTKTKGAVEAKGRDHEDDSKKAGTSRAMKMMYQMDAKEMVEKLHEDPNYVPTLEDEIEKNRQDMFEALAKSGKKGTPVTEESLKAWLERKRKRRADAAKKLVEAEMKKKKGGKGLSVLTGRDLYEYNKELFVDKDEEGGAAAAAAAANGERPADAVVNGDGDVDSKPPPDGGAAVASITDKVQSNLFLEGDDDDLDDIDDD